MNESNVYSAEINKFSSLAEQWWDPNGKFRPLHLLNPIRLEFIKQNSPPAGAAILDVGCGGGLLTESLARENASSVTGLDASEASLRVANLHLYESELEIDYVHSTVEDYAERESGQFDIITCMELLEHVPEPASTIRACSKLMKPGGSLYFSTLNRTLKSWLLGIVGAEYILDLLPRGTHQYSHFIRPCEFNRWCRSCGITVKTLTGLHYNPLSQSFHQGPGVDVNYIAHCVRS